MATRQRPEYQRVLSAAAGGVLLLIAGLIGWDLRYNRGWFPGHDLGEWSGVVADPP